LSSLEESEVVDALSSHAKVDMTLRFNMVFLTTFKACAAVVVVVVLNLLEGFGEIFFLGFPEKFSKFSYHQVEVLCIFLTTGTILVFFL